MSNDPEHHPEAEQVPENYWPNVWQTKSPNDVSWFQSDVQATVDRIVGLTNSSDHVVDVGGGASVLVDALLSCSYTRLTVNDLSREALTFARNRIGAAAEKVHWIDGDVRTLELAEPARLWHDRAVLHFLTDKPSTGAYVESLARNVQRGGFAVISTFAADGPTHCSGLAVTGRTPLELGSLFHGVGTVTEQWSEIHLTPWGAEQKFSGVVLRIG